MTDMGTDTSGEALASQLKGTVVRPGDARLRRGADALQRDDRQTAGADRSRCEGVDDVVAAVNYGREQGLDIAIRGGGHNGAGLGSVDDGLVIDLSGLNSVEVDAANRTVKIGGGALLGDVDEATNAHGLATPAGIIASTGAGGLMLGGGIGHLSRGFGLSIDNILGAEVVLADGRVVNANEKENPDLYWAIRGGGGNFGVVTSITARLHPVDNVVAGPMFWSLESAPELLRWYREFILEAPEELGGFFAFLSVPPAPPFPEELHLQKVAAVIWCWTGPAEQADEVLAEARAQPGLLLDGVQPMPLPALQSAFDPIFPPGDQWYWRADFIEEIPDEAIEQHVKFAAEAAELEVDHAPLPDRRRRASRRPDRDALGLPQRQLGPGDRRRRHRPGERQGDHRLDDRLPRGATSVLGRRRVRQHDDGRRPGAGEGQLRRELRPARQDQGRVRSWQRLPRQPEHQAGRLRRRNVPRYLVVRTFDVSEEEMPEVGRRSKEVIEGGYPQIVWEHSHVVVTDDGKVMTYCVYESPDEETVRSHAVDLGRHSVDAVHEIAGDVSPSDFPT